MARYFSGVVFIDVNTAELLILPYHFNGELQLKVPGGKSESDDEDPIRVAIRECVEEVGLKPLELIPVFRQDVPDDDDPRRVHTKFFFLCRKWEGELITRTKWDDNSFHGVPEFIKISPALVNSCFPSHRDPIRRAIVEAVRLSDDRFSEEVSLTLAAPT